MPLRTDPHTVSTKHVHATYKLAAKMTSRLIAADACSICWNSCVFPMTLAASLNSLQTSSSRTMVRTMLPSMTSVSSQISSNGVPLAHSYTTCAQFKSASFASNDRISTRPACVFLLSTTANKAVIHCCFVAVHHGQCSWEHNTYQQQARMHLGLKVHSSCFIFHAFARIMPSCRGNIM